MDEISSKSVQQLRLPRITVGNRDYQSNNQSSSAQLHNFSSTDILSSPTYVANHLSTRRLSEVDKPFYLPSLINSPNNGDYSKSVPLRIRTDLNKNRFLDTSTDQRVRRLTSNDNSGDYIRFSAYPATSAIIGLTPPRILPISNEEVKTENIRTNKNNKLIATTREEADQLALFNNSSLSYQRICFLLSRYPAIVLCFISTWMLWGRGMGLPSVSQNEQVAYIVSFSAGCFILLSQVFLSSSHHNSYKTGKILANFYHFSNLIGILISITVIVFSSISFQNAKNSKKNLDFCSLNDLDTKECITPNERAIYLSIMIGASSLIIILYIFSGVYGCIGQSLMKKKRSAEILKLSQTTRF